jgi:hypothetical protein
VTVGCGLARPIEDLTSSQLPVLSFNERAGRLERDDLTAGSTGANDKGTKQVVRLTLADGRELYCTPDHLLARLGPGSEPLLHRGRGQHP